MNPNGSATPFLPFYKLVQQDSSHKFQPWDFICFNGATLDFKCNYSPFSLFTTQA